MTRKRIKIYSCEQKVIDILKEIENKNQIKEDHLHNKLRSASSQPGAFCGLPKVHKKVIDSFSAFRTILSATGTR